MISNDLRPYLRFAIRANPVWAFESLLVEPAWLCGSGEPGVPESAAHETPVRHRELAEAVQVEALDADRG